MTTQEYPPLYPTSEGRKLLIVSLIPNILAIFSVILRLWARWIKRKPLAFNDYAIFVALAFSSGFMVLCWFAVFWAGAGHSVKDIDPRYWNRMFIILVASQPIWVSANTAVKVSALHLFMTIFPHVNFRRICLWSMAFCFVFWLGVVLSTFFFCKPIAYNWDKTIEGGVCWQERTRWNTIGALNLFMDIVIVVLPMPVLWQLTLPWSRKFGVIFMFAMGGVICMLTVPRMVYMARLDLNDFAGAVVNVALWCNLEPALGIINACLPVLRPIMSKVRHSKYLSWIDSGKSDDSDDTFAPLPEKKAKKLPDNTMDRMYPIDTTLAGGTFKSIIEEDFRSTRSNSL